jgi:two-component system response regulator MtrA
VKDLPVPHVLVVDDDAALRQLVSEYLGQNDFRVSEAAGGAQLMGAFRAQVVDLVLLDLRLPGEDGMQLLRALRAESQLPVIILTGRTEEADRVMGLELGADDYLTKPFEVAELLARIEALLRRAQNRPPQLIDSLFCFGNVIVDVGREEVLRDGSPVELTAKEFGLLRYFISKPGERLSRQVLLREVWGYVHALNTRTVDLHVAQLRQKLEVNSREPRHILTAFGSGYKFVPFP